MFAVGSRVKRKFFNQFTQELIAQGNQELSDFRWVWDSKGRRFPSKTFHVNVMTRPSPDALPDSALQTTGTGSSGKVLTGLAKRDKDRAKKILDKYKARANIEKCKKKCILGCDEGTHYWGSLRFCDLLLELDTI